MKKKLYFFMSVCLEMKFIPKVSDESVEPNTEESVFTSTCTTTTETSIETTDCESSSCWEDTETEVGSDSDSDETGSDETEFASDYGKFSAPIKNAFFVPKILNVGGHTTHINVDIIKLSNGASKGSK